MGCGCTKFSDKNIPRAPEKVDLALERLEVPENAGDRKSKISITYVSKKFNPAKDFRKAFTMNRDKNVAESLQFNTVVWGSSLSLLANCIGSKVITYRNLTARFNFYPISMVDSNRVPKIVDCLLMVLNNSKADLMAIDSLLQRFELVWNYKVLSLNHSFKEMEAVYSLDDALMYFLINDLKFTDLIEYSFSKIDSNNNKFIEISEMEAAASLMEVNYSPEDMREVMAMMDTNEDGRISFEEYKYWWKRGRQGATSMKKIMGRIAAIVASSIPGSIEILKTLKLSRRGLDMKTIKKTVSVNIGEVRESKFKVNCEFSKSAKREALLKTPNSLLQFELKNTWIALEFGLKTEINDVFIEEVKELLDGLLSTAEASVFDGHKMTGKWGFEVKREDKSLFIGIWIDLSLFEQQLKPLTNIENFWKTPVDDYFKLEASTNAKFEDFFQQRANAVLSLGSKIKIKSSIWHTIPNIVAQAISDSPFYVIAALLMAGDLKMNVKRIDSPFVDKIEKLVRTLADEVLINPLVNQFFTKAQGLFKENVSLYARFHNFGAFLKLYQVDLTKLMS